jgi:hypothetical protein
MELEGSPDVKSRPRIGEIFITEKKFSETHPT